MALDAPQPSFSEIFAKAGKRAMGGGKAGAMAMVLQVVLLMWLRTTINYMYRNGGTMGEAFSTLYADGGIGRFYQGLLPALFQGPISRFGDTAANEGVKVLLESAGLSVMVVTFFSSWASSAWRIVITPLATVKTSMQVNGGAKGIEILAKKVAENGPLTLWSGSLGTAFATFVGNYPWWGVYNFIDAKWEQPPADRAWDRLVRNASMGLCASLVSDICSNGVRVITTVVAASEVELTYMAAFNQVYDVEGIYGVLFRGLNVKLISNAISAILFSVLWKYFMSLQKKDEAKKDSKQK